MKQLSRMKYMFVLYFLLTGLLPSASLTSFAAAAPAATPELLYADDEVEMAKQRLRAEIEDCMTYFCNVERELAEKATKAETPELYKRTEEIAMLLDMAWYQLEQITTTDEIDAMAAMVTDIRYLIDKLRIQIEEFEVAEEMVIPDEAIDLGLPSGTKWAPWNVGASKPEGYGCYYAWGETEEKDVYDWSTYIHCDGSRETCYDLGSDIAGTQYDVAHVKWGSSWTMPTKDQVNELFDYCTSEWTTFNGVNGRKFIGPNGNSIFIPAASYIDESGLRTVGWLGSLRLSTWNFSSPGSMTVWQFVSGSTAFAFYPRSNGMSVRPVISGNTPSDNIIFADANVKAICVENWDTNGDGELSYEEAAAVKDLGKVFKGNESIKTFDELKLFIGLTIIPNEAFARCYGLQSLILPESVSAISAYAFGWCRQLTSIELPPHLSYIGYAAFYECTALTSIELPETLLRVDQGAFERCDALTSIMSHCGIPPSSTTNSCSFSESTYNNATLYVPTGSKADYQAAVNWSNFINIEEFGEAANLPYAVLSNDNTVLTFYYDNQKERRGGMSVGPFIGSIRREWNDYAETITKVVIDESFVNCATITSTAFWFTNFNNLTTIDGISNLRTDNVTDMKFMFEDCFGLEMLDLSSFNTSNVTNMQVMFQNCRHLKNLNIKNFNTSMVTYFTQMFMGCGELDELDVRNFNTEKAKDMTWMFAYCDNLTNIDLSYFNTNNVEGMGQMFEGCSGLTTLDLSSFNTQNVLYMFNMFRNCNNLSTIYVSEGWTTANINDYSGQSMFTGCTKLVGGKGTLFNENNIDYTYAHIDGGTGNPGYFTDKNDEGLHIVPLDEDNRQLTIENASIYNLSGQRMSKPQRGVNIIDGKKIVVK